MSTWEKLAEARIQEWLRRPPGERPRGGGAGQVVPLETQLLEAALELARRASTLPEGAARLAVEREGEAIETRLFILLESSGRPLAAQRFAELLARAKRELNARE